MGRPLKFGLFYLPTCLPEIRDVQTHYRGIIEQVEFADRVGIDYVWLVEHRERVEEGVELVKQAWAGPTLEFKSRFRPPMSGLPILPPIYQKPHPPIWVACLL